MPVRNIKYDKSSMLQRDLPNANFICTDSDGLKFNPSEGDDKVNGLAQNTHHVQESNSVLWNNIKLDWTRQAVGIYTNSLTANQASACEDGTTTGFNPNSLTLTRDTSIHIEGSASLKLQSTGVSDCSANVGGDTGAIRLNMIPGKTYTFSAYEYVPSATGLSPNDGRGLKIVFYWKESGGSYQSVSSEAPTATDTWQKLSVTKTLPENTVEAFIRLYNGFSTSGKVNYWDKLMIEEGEVAHDWIAGGTSVPLTDFKTVISLLGLTDGGEESLIGEKMITTCPTTATNEVINFDLLKSACQTPFTRESGAASSGKIQLNLPKRYSNYESITLNRVWVDGWSKRKGEAITGGSNGSQTNIQLYWNIPYTSGMQTDFDDIRFVDYDGKTLLDHFLITKTDGSSATYMVNVPKTPVNGVLQNIYHYYGNSNASNTSNGYKTFPTFDDFEDGFISSIWTQDKPVGSITESGGTLNITVDAGINGDWNTTKTAPVIDLPMPSYNFAFYTKINSYAMPDGCSPGIVIWKDRNNAYLYGRHRNDGASINDIRINKLVNGTYTGGVGTSAVTTLPLWLRVLVMYNSNGTVTYTFAYSTDGYTWTSTYSTSSMEFTPIKVGIHGRKWGSASATVPFEYAFIRKQPTMSYGSWGSEESTQPLTPDSTNPDDTAINFTAPSDWSANSYAYLNFKEYDSSNITTRSVPLSVQNIAQLGYNGLDAFDTMRLKIESECSDDYTFKFNNFEYIYEI